MDRLAKPTQCAIIRSKPKRHTQGSPYAMSKFSLYAIALLALGLSTQASADYDFRSGDVTVIGKTAIRLLRVTENGQPVTVDLQLFGNGSYGIGAGTPPSQPTALDQYVDLTGAFGRVVDKNAIRLFNVGFKDRRYNATLTLPDFDSAQGGHWSPSAVAPATMNLYSKSVDYSGNIAVNHSCYGSNLSMHLSWYGAPENTESFAIVIDHPLVTGDSFVHWNVFDIGPNINEIQAGASNTPLMPVYSVELLNDYGDVGYDGPCSNSTQRYYVRVYALNTRIWGDDLPTAPLTRSEFEQLYAGNI